MSYIKNQANRNAQLSDPVEYNDVRNMLRFVRERRLKQGPLTREEQAEFNRMWSILSVDRLRDIASSTNILRTDTKTVDDLYDVYYDYINHLVHRLFDIGKTTSMRPTNRIPFALNYPYAYWRNDKLRKDIDKSISATSQDQLRDYLATLPNVDLNDLASMNKPELIRYLDTIMIDAHNRKRDEYLQTLHNDMNVDQKSDDLWIILTQLSLDDLTSILDEYSLEHRPNVTHDEAVDLIESYFDVFRSSEPRSARSQLRTRKQP